MEFNGTFLATIVTFIVFVLLMNKILYAPILNIMEERKSFIDDNYKAATENDAKTSELNTEMEVKLSEAKEDARDKYNEIVDDFKKQRADIISSAQGSAKNGIDASRIELENVSNEVKQRLKSSMTGLASDIVEKVIGQKIGIQEFDDEKVNQVLWEK